MNLETCLKLSVMKDRYYVHLRQVDNSYKLHVLFTYDYLLIMF